MNRFIEVYWVIYFVGYLIAIGLLLWLYWRDLTQGDKVIYPLSAIFSTAAGAASAFAIIVEVGGRMVLLIPAAVKKLKNEGRKEGIEQGILQGIEQGIEQGVEQERAQWVEWLREREEAAANDRPFDDPPPSQRD